MKTRCLTVRGFAFACLSTLSALWLTPASAALWTYPGEISVAEAYNNIYFTNYDTTTQEGLAALVADHGISMPTTWSMATARSVVVLAMDSSNTSPVGILVNGTTFIPIKDPGAWTSPSRGWFDDPLNSPNWQAAIVDIPTLLTNNGFATNTPFVFAVGSTVMDATNTYRLNNNNTNSGYLLAYNEGGLNSGDGDANEPIIYVNPPTFIPGTCNGMRPTIVGTPGRDIIYVPEGAGQQVVMALGYADIIYGSSGDDIICGGDGNDIIYGGAGNDTIFGDDGSDRIYGEDGDDIIHGGAGIDSIDGGAGNNQLYGDDGNDLIEGGTGDDYIDGGAGDDRLIGNGGNDTINGGAGDDLLDASAELATQSAQLDGGDGNDRLIGGLGNDTMTGGLGDDHIYGDGGDDTVNAGDGDDYCDGGDGYDTETGCERATTFEVMN